MTTRQPAYRAGIISTLQLGANSDGERDDWQFVSFITRTDGANAGLSIGTNAGLNGIAAAQILAAITPKITDSIVFADSIIANASPVAENGIRFGYTTAHEAAHTFGLEHTSETGTTNDQLSDSDIIVGSASATTVKTLPSSLVIHSGPDNPPPNEVNNYDRLSSNNVLGIAAGAPDYVTGTGAGSLITITKNSATTAQVTVQAFQRGTNYVTAFDIPGQGAGSSIYSYVIDYTNGVLVPGGFGRIDHDRRHDCEQLHCSRHQRCQ